MDLVISLTHLWIREDIKEVLGTYVIGLIMRYEIVYLGR